MKWDEIARLVDINTLLNTAGWLIVGILTAAEKLLPEGKSFPRTRGAANQWCLTATCRLDNFSAVSWFTYSASQG